LLPTSEFDVVVAPAEVSRIGGVCLFTSLNGTEVLKTDLMGGMDDDDDDALEALIVATDVADEGR
jgi:hypothetical protein